MSVNLPACLPYSTDRDLIAVPIISTQSAHPKSPQAAVPQ
jgi:hypothetical protein